MSDSNNGGAGQTLGGAGGESLPSSWARPSNSAPRIGRVGNLGGGNSSSRNSGGPRIGTLRDVASTGGRSSARKDSDDDSDEGEGGENLFAGGERSGLSIQTPGRPRLPGGDIIKDLLKKAAEAGRSGTPESASGSSSNDAFRGSGMTLGGEGSESRLVQDPNARPEEQELAIRRVTLWRNGFNIEDGPLRDYEDPANQTLVRQLIEGTAPPELINIRFGQPVDVRIDERRNEDYVPSNVPSQAFSGSGQRLGAPSSGPTGSSASMPGAFQGSPSGVSPSSEPERSLDSAQTIFEVSNEQPTTRILVRFADGTRETVTMNLTHTVADIRNFINFSRRESNSRPYTITSTNTFPPRALDDDSKTVKDAKLEKSVVMQKWV